MNYREMLKKIIKEVVSEFHNDGGTDSLDRPRMRVKMKPSVLGANLFGGKDFVVLVENGDWYFPSPGIAIDKSFVDIIGPKIKLPAEFSN